MRAGIVSSKRKHIGRSSTICGLTAMMNGRTFRFHSFHQNESEQAGGIYLASYLMGSHTRQRGEAICPRVTNRLSRS